MFKKEFNNSFLSAKIWHIKGVLCMLDIVLIKPDLSYSEDIMAYRKEMLDNRDSLDGTSCLERYDNAEAWLEHLATMSDVTTCPKEFVTSTTYIGVRQSDNKIVGMIDLRHHINHPILSVWGGHIGYSVRPSERRKGYAKAMLKLVLEEAKKHHLTKVLVTCNHDNLGSNKTIIANGGVFEKTIELEGTLINRYWIDIE